jgi:hypothetical protein
LRAIAAESAKLRRRETAGIGVDELIACHPDHYF